MSELIVYTTEVGRSQIKDEMLEVAAVVKDSLTTQFAKRRVAHGLCVIAEVSSGMDEYRGQWP